MEDHAGMSSLNDIQKQSNKLGLRSVEDGLLGRKRL